MSVRAGRKVYLCTHSPHHGPAAHQSAPIQTPDCWREHNPPWIAAIQTSLDPPPISPRNPLKLLALSQAVAAAKRSAPMVEETQVAEVPEPSESRYWCISKAKLLLGSVRVLKASPLPDETQAEGKDKKICHGKNGIIRTPCATVRGPLDEDKLAGSAGSPNAVNRSLVQRSDK